MVRIPIKAEGARIVYDSPGSTVYDLREIGLGYEIVKKDIVDDLYEKVQTLDDLVKENERLSKSWQKPTD